jgi:hypothetical protein
LEVAVVSHKDVATAILADEDSRFTLNVLSWDDGGEEGPEDWLLVGLDVVSPPRSWSAKASIPLASGLSGLADTADGLAEGGRAGPAEFATDDGCLAFRFEFHPDTGGVDVEVVVRHGDEGLPACTSESRLTCLLRVSPEQIAAFATALEQISRSRPRDLHWVG